MCGIGVEINDQHIFFEAFGARQEAALGVEGATSAIEDQIVIAANLIDVGEGKAVAARHLPEHALAQFLLACGERRRRKIENGVGAGLDKDLDGVFVVAAPLPEISVVPDILADTHAKAAAVPFEHLRAVRGLEVTVLIEDVVSGKKGLVERGAGCAFMQKYGAVEKRPAHIRRVGRSHAYEHGRSVLQICGDVR